ncbi:MAG TPA: hypothetical protein VHX11_07775, partial [Acidobacteriaceae bacterium]|nr:hypothetical protein [Acidobacteriaceae bacterium]
ILVKVGAVETTHPEAGSAKHAAEPPPTPDKIRAMLPKLADLPKEAEEKAKTIEDFRAQIRSLKAQLAARPVEEKVKVETKIVEVKVVTDQQIAELKATLATLSGIGAALSACLASATNRKVAAPPVRSLPSLPKSKPLPTRIVQAPLNGDGGDLTAAQVRVLSRLVELMECAESESVRKEQLAAWAEYSPNSGGFNNYLGSLRTAGMIHYPRPGMVAITDEGRKHAAPEDVPATSDEMLDRAKRVLGGSEGKLLELLHATREATSKTDLAEAAGFSPNSGGFNNYLGHMRTLGFVEYPQPGQVKCADWLYLNGDAA